MKQWLFEADETLTECQSQDSLTQVCKFKSDELLRLQMFHLI